MKEETKELAKELEVEPKSETKKNVPDIVVEEIAETLIYIGPTVRAGLRENAMFSGTRSEIEKHLEVVLGKTPQVKAMLVTAKQLNRAKIECKTKGTLRHKYYHDILSMQ